MIGPKVALPSKAEETEAYELSTIRDDDTCQRCRRDCGPTARDHRQNRQPGNTTVDNLQVLGLRCHLWKTEHAKEANAQGWGVPAFVIRPGDYPAARWLSSDFGTLRLGWVLYEPDGRFIEISEAEARRRIEDPNGFSD